MPTCKLKSWQFFILILCIMSIFFSQLLLPNNKKIICHCKHERQNPPIGEDRQLDLIEGSRYIPENERKNLNQKPI